MTPITLTFTDRIQLLRADEQMAAFRWTRERMSKTGRPPRNVARLCTVPGCHSLHYAKGRCQAHYKRLGKALRDLPARVASDHGERGPTETD